MWSLGRGVSWKGWTWEASLSMYQGFCRTRQSPMCQVNWKELGQGYHWESYLDGLGKANLPGYSSVLYELLDKVQWKWGVNLVRAVTGSGEGGDPKEVMKKGTLKLLTWCQSHNSNSGPQMELVFSFRDPYGELPLTSQFSRRSTESVYRKCSGITYSLGECWSRATQEA